MATKRCDEHDWIKLEGPNTDRYRCSVTTCRALGYIRKGAPGRRRKRGSVVAYKCHEKGCKSPVTARKYVGIDLRNGCNAHPPREKRRGKAAAE